METESGGKAWTARGHGDIKRGGETGADKVVPPRQPVREGLSYFPRGGQIPPSLASSCVLYLYLYQHASSASAKFTPVSCVTSLFYQQQNTSV